MQHIKPTPQTLHGIFSPDLTPVAQVQPGETVRFTTYDAAWHTYDSDTDELVHKPSDDPDARHALCGPLYIEGAQPGMTLEIQIGDIQVAPLGWNIGGGGDREHWRRLGVSDEPTHFLPWQLDSEAGIATSADGWQVKLDPFMGVMGMPPPEPGRHSTVPPRSHGGNIDCKLLTAGTTLYLPISVEGALFSTGDGHAAQGDGEASIYAIECPVEAVDLTFQLHDDLPIQTPRARVHGGWATFGFHESLDDAMYIALNAMLDLMQTQHDISRKQALALASVAVDLRITQVVNGTKGVHAVLPDEALKRVNL